MPPGVATGSTVFTPIPGMAVTLPCPLGGNLVCWFYMSLVADAAEEADFQLVLDGVPVPSAFSACFVPNGANASCASIAFEILGVAPGPHTVSVNWRSLAGIALQCDPTAIAGNQGSSLTVANVTV